MRTTITLDDELLARAHEMTGVAENSTPIHDGLRLLIQRAAARRLAALGGSAPDLALPPRRRSAPARKKPSPRGGSWSSEETACGNAGIGCGGARLHRAATLAGRGIGYIDIHLLASTLMTPLAKLWTRDRRMGGVAEALGVQHDESSA